MINIRAKLFWYRDAFLGYPVKSHFTELTNFYSGKLDIERRNTIQKNKLQKLLLHAVNTVPAYRKSLLGYNLNCINDFPIIDKNVIKSRLNDFICEAPFKGIKKVTTSGSTGIPFTAFWNRDKANRSIAETIYFFDRQGFSIGERIYFFRVWNEVNQLSWLTRKYKNIIPVDISSLNSNNAKKVLQQIEKDHGNKIILGYASAISSFYQLCGGKQNMLFQGKMKAIFAMSEPFTDVIREQLQRFFNCPIVSRYSNSENGLIAHQYSGLGEIYRINHASYLVEIFDLNEDQILPDGELGRIIVTDLYNYTMPFIRYDTGDIGIMGEKLIDGTLERVLTRIEGRKLDMIYSANGDLISPHVVDYALRRLDYVRQFQLVQTESYSYKVLINAEIVDENRTNEIIITLKKYLGPDAVIEVIKVDEIPLLSSGKHKLVSNEYYSKKKST